MGFSSANNAHHMTDLPPDGEAMAVTIRNALERAGVSPDEIGYINAHGSSTPQNDVFDTNAYKSALGPAAYRIPISSSKSMVGHALAAASAIGTVSAILAMRHRMVPPTINQSQPDPRCDLDYVPNHARAAEIKRALVTASGFSGIHSALVLGAAP
jgi:3-oxoacyl-(acyl-carrier-protein) synthase